MTKKHKINHLVAYDIAAIAHGLACDDVSYLVSVLCGDGWTQYNNMTDNEMDVEYRECVSSWGSDYEKSHDSLEALRWRKVLNTPDERLNGLECPMCGTGVDECLEDGTPVVCRECASVPQGAIGEPTHEPRS